MTEILTWCDREGRGPILLYTESAALYAPFDFEPLVEHAFAGPAPSAIRPEPAEQIPLLDRAAALNRLLPGRTPVSDHCAVIGADDLIRSALRDEDVLVARLPQADALVAYEIDADELVIIDVIAATIPCLARIVGALHPEARCVRTLFPPDKLSWCGRPDADDTGLMIRGPVPAAMRRPFMLPPTVSF